MQQHHHEQSAQLDRHYHEAVNPHESNKAVNVLLVACSLVLLALVAWGAYNNRDALRQTGTLFFYGFLFLAALIFVLTIVYLLWHKWYMDKQKREHAMLDVQAKKEQMQREHQRLHPDHLGNYPAIYDPKTKDVLTIPPGNFVQPVPAHLHYETNYSDTSTRTGQEQLTAQAYTQPPLSTIIEELTPNTLEIVFGLDATTGQLARTTLPKAVHIQLLGASGQGKSRQATSILTQLCARNDTQHLNLALVDCEGETTVPFQQLPHVRYLADEPKEAAKTFRGLVSELERRDVSRILWPVIFIFVEEFLNLRRTMPAEYRDQALEDYTTLALRGRKRGMFLFSIGQTAYTEKAIRDAQMQFLSSMAFAIKPSAAGAAGFTNRPLLNQLYNERRPGQFLLERPAGDAILLAPFVEPRDVPGLLTPSVDTSIVEVGDPLAPQQRPTSDPGRNPLEDALQAKLGQVRQLIASGTVNKPDIILAVWGVRSGSSEKYKQAEQEYKQIMAALVGGQAQEGV